MKYLLAIVFFVTFNYLSTPTTSAQTSYPSSVTYNDSSAGDQDDMAIWVHPTSRSQSTVIGSDKHGDVYVYDLNGSTVQSLTPPGSEPGNIDVRYNFPLNGQLVDIVGHNRREGSDQVVLYKVNSDRTITRVDNNTIQTSATYGFCLYHSKITGKFHAFTTSKSGHVEQYELFDAGGGLVDGTKVREFEVGSQTEGCVADDDYGYVYMAEEGKSGAGAIWKYGAEPGSGSSRTKVDDTNGHLAADVEGITIYHTGNGGGYIIASSQGPNEFDVYQRTPPHSYVTTYKINGASSTDGIDVTSASLGSTFPQGVFLAHSGGDAILGTPWQTIASGEGLTIDTSWDPRSGVVPPPPTGNPTATPTPTTPPGVTNTPTPTPPSGSCTISNNSYQTIGIGSNTGQFAVEFDSVPDNTSVNGVTGLSTSAANAYTDMAALVRFNQNGTIDVRDGGSYRSDTTINYSAGVNYHFRMVIDTSSKTYDVYVRPGSSSEIRVASNYNFRNEQSTASTLSYLNLRSTNGSYSVCNISVGGSGVTPSPGDCTPTNGDANGDGQATPNDFSSWAYYFHPFNTISGGPSVGDFNCDGFTNATDFSIWSFYFVPVGGGPTATPTGPLPTIPPPSGDSGIWISPEEVAQLPTSGSAWNFLMSYADNNVDNPSLQLRDYNEGQKNMSTLAKALVFVKTGNESYRQEVRTILGKIIGTHDDGDQLAVNRNTYSYVIAADLIDLKNYDPGFDSTFRSFIRSTLRNGAGGSCSSIVECHEKRPNNWGTHAFASRVAIALYLNDNTELQRAISVHKGYLGDRTSYSDFDYGDLDWQCDKNNPVGINPKNCRRTVVIDNQEQDVSIDGVIPDDQRRCSSSFKWPPCKTNYMWEGLQGLHAGSVMLHRAGYPAFEWEDRAVLRAVQWLNNTIFEDGNTYPAEGDDKWQPYLTNYYYGTSYQGSPSTGKGMGFTSWTHGR